MVQLVVVWQSRRVNRTCWLRQPHEAKKTIGFNRFQGGHKVADRIQQHALLDLNIGKYCQDHLVYVKYVNVPIVAFHQTVFKVAYEHTEIDGGDDFDAVKAMFAIGF